MVDGLITDENASYYCQAFDILFRIRTEFYRMVSGATVYITDDAGNSKSILKSSGHGIYKTDSTEFRGAVGRTVCAAFKETHG